MKKGASNFMGGFCTSLCLKKFGVILSRVHLVRNSFGFLL